MVELAVALFGGGLAGYIGAVSSSGGLLSLPLLLFLGLPTPSAIATNRFAAFGLMSAAIPKYAKAKKVDWGLAYKLMPLALLGGVIGSNFVVDINESLLSGIVAVSLLVMLPVVLLAKQPEQTNTKKSTTKTILGYILYFALLVYGGLVGAGMGLFLLITLVHFFNLTFVKAVATNFAAWFVMSVAAVAVFALNGLVDYRIGIPMGIGMFIGGQIGASHAIKKGDELIRLFLVVVIIASTIKLLF